MYDVQLEPTGHKLPPEIKPSRLPQYLVSVLILALLVFANLLGVVTGSAKLGKGFQQEADIITFPRGKEGTGVVFCDGFVFAFFRTPT